MWKKILNYLDLRTLFAKPKPGEVRPDFNLRMMHGINRISIFMFIICLIILLFRYVIK
jgi:hypothetical protein